MRDSSPVALGQVIAGKYKVQGVLGEGGMGVVVSAWHLGLDQRVAIKLLLSHMQQADGSALERFQREARAAARIQSEHVCRVLDTGHLEDGTPFLVMEYLEGSDLSDELLRRGRFEVGEAVRYVREACIALMHAHQAGVIHRDLKPANLFLVERPDGTRLIKVLDFGVSKSTSSSGAPNLTLTKTSAMVGSPLYMSPEQLNSSRDVDGRTDLWALGVILYELISGRTPFYGESIAQLVNAVLNTEPETFAKLGIEAPPGLEQIIRKALAKSRDQRYATAKDLYAALAPFAGERVGASSGVQSQKPPLPTRSMNEVDAPLPPPTTEGQAAASGPVATHQSTADATRKRVRTALVALLLIALAGVAAILSRRGGKEEAQGAETTSAQPSPATPAATQPPPSPPSAPPAAVEAKTMPAPSSPLAAEPNGSRPAEQDAALSPASQTPAMLEPRRARERPRSKDVPASAPGPKPESPDEYLPNFGGRR